MDRRVWLDLGARLPTSPERVRATLTVEEPYSERVWTYEVYHGSVVRESLDVLDCPGWRRVRTESGELRIEDVPELGKRYLLRTWEPLE